MTVNFISMLASLIYGFGQKQAGPTRPAPRGRARKGTYHRTALGIEFLEDRCTPAALTFDYPIGPPDGLPRSSGTAQSSNTWQNVQDFGVPNPSFANKYHLGEDWNFGFGSDDLGKPVFAAADGVVTYARDAGAGWYGVIIIKHTGDMHMPDGTTVSQVETEYGHLDASKINSWVVENQFVYRGQLIGVIGPHPDGPHLHFELHTTVGLGAGPGYSYDLTGRTDPSNFIDANSPPPGPFDADFNTGSLSDAGLGSARPGSNAQIVSALGSVSSPDRTAFMAVTTNASAPTDTLGGTQGSVVYSKAFVVPPGGILRFEYDFLTNENPQSSAFNDFAAVNLLDAFGKKLATLKYIDTYSSLNGGSGGGYAKQTGWFPVAFDLSPYAGPGIPVKLQIVASDRADTVVDSALLLDNIRVVTTGLGSDFNAGTVRTAGLLPQWGSSAKVVPNLGTVGPYDGSNFVMIDNKNATVSTAAFGGTTGSVLVTKTFIVPQNGVLTFAFNFLTNEATPDATYNDFAQLNLLTATGSKISTLWSINTYASGFVSASGSGYAKKTGWRQASINLSAFAGQQVKLQFIVSDKSDNSVDTALLIDNLFVR